MNSNLNFAQKTVSHAFHNNFVIGLDGGVTLPQTDYLDNKIGLGYRVTGEYYFKTNSVHLIGLKLKLSSEQIKGEDDRGTISTQDGTRQIPPAFTTDIYTIGFEALYSFSIGSVLFPYLSGGISNIWFFPEDDQGIPAVGGNANLYEKSTVAYSLEFGFKYLVSDQFGINLFLSQIIPQSDYLDDVAAASANDSYSSIMVGFSYSPFYNSDADNDGISGSSDLCPDEPEDFDGFEDEDGCPDLDNDADGIWDSVDKCPNEAEDFDGFEDEDGCPDLDNDDDGIPDVADECPNAAEDLDSIEDEDGCPDEEKIFNEQKIILKGNDIFPPNSAMIKVEGKQQLDNVITQLKKISAQKWRIEGHVDSNGNERFLKNLSFDRAKAIQEYFSYFGGLDEQDFEVVGLGDDFPVDDNDTEEGRRNNNRIEIITEIVEEPTGNTDKQAEEFNKFILRADDSFETNTANLTLLAKLLLDEIATYIKNQPTSQWRIEGYTDSQGTASMQKRITLDRANAVYDYLISKGLSEEQFKVSGLGSSNPIANNDSEEGRSTNRRILIIRIQN